MTLLAIGGSQGASGLAMLMRMTDSSPPMQGLYVVTPSAPHPGGGLFAGVEAALCGGAGAVQYRDKSADTARRRHEAAGLRDLCQRYGALLLINDDLWLAREVGADGVHLGEHDTAVGEARHRLGAHALLGASCYDSPAAADSAIRAGADYVAFGSVFASAVKPDAQRMPLALLRRECQRLAVPVVAIGGIDASNVGAVVAAGVAAVAVVSGVFSGDDIAASARAIVDHFD